MQFFPEEACTGGSIEGEFRAAEERGWSTSWILGYERQGTSASSISFWTGALKDVIEPAGDLADSAIVLVVSSGVTMAGSVPIGLGKQFVGEHAGGAEAERESLSPRGIAGSGGIANQGNAVTIRLLHPDGGGLELSEWSDGTCAMERIRVPGGRLEELAEAREVGVALQARTGLRVKAKISA